MGIIKIMDGTPFNFKGFEKWLNNMANQGPILAAIIRPWCVFMKQEPRDINTGLNHVPFFMVKSEREIQPYGLEICMQMERNRCIL